MTALQTRGGKLALASFVLLAVLAFQRTLAGDGGARYFSLFLAVCFVFQAFATWRSGVTVEGAEVVIRNRYRTITVPLRSVERIEVRRTWRGRSLVLRSTDGRSSTSDLYFGEIDDEVRSLLPVELATRLATGPSVDQAT